MAESPQEALSPEETTAIGRRFMETVRWNRELGFVLDELYRGMAVVRVPYDPRFASDPETGVLHGGVITAALDACCGAAVMSHPTGAVGTATLDLRLDYMRPARPGADVWARAECFKATRHVAFVRAVAHDGDESDPVASAAGAFTLERPKGKKP